MHQRAASLALVVPALASCVADVPDVDETFVQYEAQGINTDYATSWGDRFIYARGKPQGTYVVQYTWKAWDKCDQSQHVMALLPPSETTVTICGKLGLDSAKAQGGGFICVETATRQAEPVYAFKWTDWNARELNYRVVDRGPSSDYDISAWLPATPGNGCPRP